MRIRGALSALLAGALSLIVVVPAFAADVLIYGPSNATEQGVAEGGGHTVTVADATTWAGMTTEQFAAFDAIVIGDAGCTSEDAILDAAVANRAVWSAAVTGPITLNTFDPGAHVDKGNQTTELTLNSINYASSGTGTGLYFTLGCYYDDGDVIIELTILDEFGTFTVDGVSGNLMTIVNAAHAVMTGLTEEGLDFWGSSTHAHFLTFPTWLEVLTTEGGELIKTPSVDGLPSDGQTTGGDPVIAGKGGGSLIPLPVILAGVEPTPTPTPTPAAATATPSPAASALPDTTASAPGTPTGLAIAALVLLVAAAGFGTIELRRRGVSGRP
jgi:hypothetical protein